MSNKHKFLDDIAKLTGNAAGVVLESGKTLQDKVKSLVSRNLSEMDVVTRDEFEAVKKMVEKARLENEELKKRLDTLEGKKEPKTKITPSKTKKAPSKPTKKVAAKKPTNNKTATKSKKK